MTISASFSNCTMTRRISYNCSFLMRAFLLHETSTLIIIGCFIMHPIGYVEDIRFYGRALSANEVLTIYNTGTA